MQIHIIRKRKKTSVDVSPSDTLDKLRKKIQEQTSVAKVAQILLLEKEGENGGQGYSVDLGKMPDTTTVQECGMEANDVIDLLTMRIHVKHVNWNEGNLVSIDHDVHRKSLVHEVKKLVQDKTDVPMKDQRLVFNGQILDDDNKTLADYEVGHEDTLIIDDCISVSILHQPSGKTILTLGSVSPKDTIHDLKYQIQSMVHILIDDQHLLLDGKEFLIDNDMMTLRECDIPNNAKFGLNNEIHGMEIKIQLPTREVFTISNVQPMTETLGTIKKKIQEIQNIPCDCQYLDLMGNPLKDDTLTLMDYSVKHGDTIDLTPHREKLTPPGGMTVFIRQQDPRIEDGKKWTDLCQLHVHPKDTLHTVKRNIQNTTSILIFLQQLSFEETLLTDDRPTLHFVGVRNMNTLELVSKPMELKVRTNQNEADDSTGSETEIFLLSNMDRFDTILDVKKKIETLRGTPVAEQNLSYKGSTLSDPAPVLFDLRIMHGDILDLMYDKKKKDKVTVPKKTLDAPAPDVNRKERTNYKYERTTRTWYWGKINKYAKNDRIGISFVKDEEDGNFYVATVSKVAESYTEARVHDRLLKFQEQDASAYDTAEEMHQIMRDVMSFTLETIHPVPKQAGDDDKDPSDDIELEMGDIVRLKNSKELDGTRVELKRQTASGKWMVTPLKSGKTMLVNRNQIKVDE